MICDRVTIVSSLVFVLAITAVQRVRDYLFYADGKIPTKPTMAATFDYDFEIERWTVPSIVELLRESQRLAENIYQAEIDVQNVDKLLRLLAACRRDNESYVKRLAVRIITIDSVCMCNLMRGPRFHDLSRG